MASAFAVQILPARVLGRAGGISPSGRINVGVVGCGLISQGHRKFYATSPYTQIMALCDVDRNKLSAVKEEIDTIAKSRTDKAFRPVDTHHYYEELIARDDIDAVCICTPDHWHVPIALKAVEDGKAVYVEKPMSLTISEGRILADAVKRRGTVLQVGSQQRSDRFFRKAAELVRNGYIGKILKINTRIGVFPPEPQNLPEEPVPEGFDYDRWLGSTPWRPYNPERVRGHYGGGWRCFYEYGARKEGDWGAHHFDIIQWALGMDDSGPVEFYPEGADGSEYRHYRYADGTTIYVNAPTDGHMIQFIGSEGEIGVSRSGKMATTPANLMKIAMKSGDTRLHVSNDHRMDFIDAIRFGRRNICPAEIGHRSATVCHLMSMARRLKKPVRWDPKTETILDNPEAAAMMSRPRRAPYFLGV